MCTVNKCLCLFALTFLFLGCGGDKEKENPFGESGYRLSFTKSVGGAERTSEIEDGDDINITVGDTIILHIDPDDDEPIDRESVKHTSSLAMTRISPLNYRCIALKIGRTPVSVHYGNMSKYFMVDTESWEEIFIIREVPAFTVETGRDDLSAKILNELEEEYIPFFLEKMRFTYNEPQSGTIDVTNLDSELNYSGTFSRDENRLYLVYKGTFYTFIITKSGSDSAIWINDRTAYYQNLYPEGGITQVQVALNLIEISE